MLLVEDDPVDAAFLRTLLERAGLHPYHLEHVPSLGAAVAALGCRGPFDVVVLDLGLPDTSGLDGVTSLRALAPETPLVVLTGADDDELARQAAAQSVQDYLVKWDFDPGTLARALRYAVERNQLRMELRAEKERAESASRAKGEFLANISHEIRTPMNIVLGMTELLRNTPLNGKQLEQLTRLESAGDHLMGLLENVLDLSRIEAGRVELESSAFNVAQQMSIVCELVRPVADRKNISLVLELEPDLPSNVFGDPRRLRQVLLNLLGNAVKFTESGRVTLSVWRPPGGRTSGVVAFRVVDTGPGIPTERLGAVFEQFVQADATVGREHGGAGLGLAIARSLVHLMRGEISVTSVVGEGTTFTVTIPLATSLRPSRQSLPRVVIDLRALEGALSSPGPRLRVLLVDDCADNHALLDSYVAELNVVVRWARTGEEAVIAFGEDSYDVVLLDLHMPGMDGYATVRALRAHEQAAHAARTPMLALSADVLAESMARAKDAGCDAYLSKPLRRATFLEALVEHGARRRRERGERGELDDRKESSEAAASLQLLTPPFLDRKRTDSDTMRACLALGDFKTIATLAHNLRGTGGAFGFPELTTLGGALESAARASDRESVSRNLDSVVLELGRAESAQAAHAASGASVKRHD